MPCEEEREEEERAAEEEEMGCFDKKSFKHALRVDSLMGFRKNS